MVNFEGPALGPGDRAHVAMAAQGGSWIVDTSRLYRRPTRRRKSINDPGGDLPVSFVTVVARLFRRRGLIRLR